MTGTSLQYWAMPEENLAFLGEWAKELEAYVIVERLTAKTPRKWEWRIVEPSRLTFERIGLQSLSRIYLTLKQPRVDVKLPMDFVDCNRESMDICPGMVRNGELMFSIFAAQAYSKKAMSAWRKVRGALAQMTRRGVWLRGSEKEAWEFRQDGRYTAGAYEAEEKGIMPTQGGSVIFTLHDPGRGRLPGRGPHAKE